MRKIHIGAVVTALSVVCCLNGRAFALGEETFGNAPLNEQNYRDWPGVMPLVNYQARVYHSWVNGNEHFRYKGTVAELNECLANFAKLKAKTREVLLRPGPGGGKSFHGKEVPHDWALHINGGISKHVTTLDKGDQVWSVDPVLTIYVGGDIELEKIEFPDGVTLVDAPTVAKRVAAGMTASTDKTVRGWGNGQLAQLDPYSAENAKTIAGMLDDADDWVRLNAAGSLGFLGRTAEPHLPALRKLLDSPDAALAERARETIAAIEAAPDRAEERQRHAETQKEIAAFIAAREKK